MPYKFNQQQCYGQEEWHTEKYGIKGKKDWRKIHLVVDNYHIIQCSELTDRNTQDVSMVDKLVKPINKKYVMFLEMQLTIRIQVTTYSMNIFLMLI